MSTRKLVTISIPPELLKKAERVAEEENRSKSELLREALRFYIDTSRPTPRHPKGDRRSGRVGTACETPRQRMRVVLDTNVLVSATLIRDGNEDRILREWKGGKFELVISPQIIDEMGRVLFYEKFRKHQPLSSTSSRG